MTTIHTLRLLTLAGCSTLMAGTAFAQAQPDGYYYGGLSVGRSRTNIEESDVAKRLLPAGLAVTDVTRDEHDTAYRLFGGYQFTRNVGMELGYFDLGRSSFTASTAPAGALNGAFKVKGLGLDLVGTFPLTDSFSALGRIGVQRSSTHGSFSGSGAAAGVVTETQPSDRKTSYKLGAGLQYEFSPSVLMRGEAERYRVSDSLGGKGNVNVFSVSLVFPFGRSAAPAPRAAAPAYVAPAPAPAPAPVAVAAAPAPVVVAPPAPPERKRVSFSADSLFTFDQSSVGPEGKTALDAFAAQTRGTQFDSISVEGHTDRLGSDAYNQKLSTQRADAVKAYLVSSGGIDAAKLMAVGKGEASPVTKPDDCKGKAATPKLIACLQPDRRVDVEVTGTR